MQRLHGSGQVNPVQKIHEIDVPATCGFDIAGRKVCPV